MAMRFPSRLSSPRAVVVEDEPRLRELLADVVPEMGFETTAVRTGEEALRAMAADAAEIVLLDLHLPGVGGMEVFAELRRRWPATQVIVLTAHGDLAAAQGAIRLGVADFLTKPFHLSDLEGALDRARRRLADAATVESPSAERPPVTLAEAERAAILAALDRHGGNRTAAAAELGISRRKLHYWLNENPVDP
jgi:two-component system response regulator FlrC